MVHSNHVFHVPFVSGSNSQKVIASVKLVTRWDWTFIIICISLLFVGVRVTSDLHWPADLDQFRDIAQTQSIIDGDYGHDPYYQDEHIWYNPGLHLIYTGVSYLFNMSVPEVVARVGAYMNILAPITFYLMLRTLFGVEMAWLSSVAYIFLYPNVYPAWATALYSPASFSSIFAQSLFYLFIIFFYKLFSGPPTYTQYLKIGCIWGVMFLFHTTPACIAGGMLALFFLRQLPQLITHPGTPLLSFRRWCGYALTVCLPALTITFSFLFFALWYYHLHIINAYPLSWKWPTLLLSALPHLLRTEFLQPGGVLVIFGFIALCRTLKDKATRFIFLSCAGICLGALVYHYLSMAWPTFISTRFLPIPIHHFFFYYKVLYYIAFGYGLITLLNLSIEKAETWNTTLKKKCHWQKYHKVVPALILISLILLPFIYVVKVYARNGNWLNYRMLALHQTANSDFIKAYHWILKHTHHEDVFLCANVYGIRIVGAAGRKVVAIQAQFSNPYVDFQTRQKDRSMMLKSLKSGQNHAFTPLSQKYAVKYLIGPETELVKIHPAFKNKFKQVFHAEQLVILELL